MTGTIRPYWSSGNPASRGLIRVAGLVRHNLRLWLGDPEVLILLVVMPLIMMAFLRPVYREALLSAGVSGANGAEQAVPGMAVMFALLGSGILASDLHRERTWATWDRLRASGARTVEIVVGKALPPFLIVSAQLAILFVAGTFVFDLPIRGSPVGLGMVGAAFSAAMLALGLALSASIDSITTLGAVANASSVTLSGLGGAIVPVETMPGWAEAIAPVTPSYWAMQGFRRSIIGEHAGVSPEIAALALVGFAIVLGVFAAWRFRRREG